MTSRRVSVLTLALALAFCLTAASDVASAQPSEIRTRAASETSASAATPSPPVATIKLIRNAIVRSRALDRLAGYRAIPKDNVRFLVVIDRKSQRNAAGVVTHVAKDLLSTADGRLWILDRHRVRRATERDLAEHQFSLEEAQLGLSASNRRPVSLVVPRKLVRDPR